VTSWLFSGPLLEARPPTDIHTKWFKRRRFGRDVPFAVKNRKFSYPLIGRPPKGHNLEKMDFKNFRLYCIVTATDCKKLVGNFNNILELVAAIEADKFGTHHVHPDVRRQDLIFLVLKRTQIST